MSTKKRLQLCPHDPEWLKTFEAERERLTTTLGSHLLQIEHVGSTSVPGLLAKPIVDIAVAVSSESEADLCIEPLQALGYEYRGLHGDDERRRYYVLDRGGRRVMHIHLYILPAVAWDQKLRFRDVLRNNAAVREQYEREKLRVAELVDWDKAAYSLAKGPFIESMLERIAMREVRLSVKAIIIREGRLLVLKCRDQDGVWYALPGGGQVAGETLDQCLRRECLEELGCTVRMGPLRFVRDYIGWHHEFAAYDCNSHQVELMFEAYLESEPSLASEPDSMQEGFVWLDIASLPGCRLYPRVLERVLSSAENNGVTYLGDVN